MNSAVVEEMERAACDITLTFLGPALPLDSGHWAAAAAAAAADAERCRTFQPLLHSTLSDKPSALRSLHSRGQDTGDTEPCNDVQLIRRAFDSLA